MHIQLVLAMHDST